MSLSYTRPGFFKEIAVQVLKRNRYLQTSTSSYFYQINKSPDQSTGVVSAIGAVIACVFLLLVVLTAYLAFRVYKQGKKQFVAKGTNIKASTEEEEMKLGADKEEQYLRQEREKQARKAAQDQNQDFVRNQQRSSQKDVIELDVDDEEIAKQQKKYEMRGSAQPSIGERTTVDQRMTVNSQVPGGYPRPSYQQSDSRMKFDKQMRDKEIEQAQNRINQQNKDSDNSDSESYEEDQSKANESGSDNEMPQVAQHNIIAKQYQQDNQPQKPSPPKQQEQLIMREVQNNQRQNQFKKEKMPEIAVDPPADQSIEKKSMGKDKLNESNKSIKSNKAGNSSKNIGKKQQEQQYEYDEEEYYDDEEENHEPAEHQKANDSYKVQKKKQNFESSSEESGNSFNNGKVLSPSKHEKENNRPSRAERGLQRP